MNSDQSLYNCSKELSDVSTAFCLCFYRRFGQILILVWRDVTHAVLVTFYNLFYSLEDTGDLNPDDPVHIWSLHFVYLQRLQNSLNRFTEAWNNHPLRTERR